MRQTTFVKTVLRLAINAGWTIAGVDDGEEEDMRPDYTPTTATNRAMETDEATILLRHPDRENLAALFVVWQGPIASYPRGEEAVNDYTVSLDDVMEAAYAMADAN